ncbi:hypothetical protein Plec18167_007850 [Paecilomyces lecythidis]|uniref:BTB domain-containing protein n=1 Tax=Paecilomyces lecythidis TaxID=3004212 RepID=A0ABR3X0V8_9EURO
MPFEQSMRKRRCLNSESSVTIGNSSTVNSDSTASGKKSSGGEIEEGNDFWEPFKRIFNSPEHSDVDIYLGRWGELEIPAHSFVLKIRCPILANSLIRNGTGNSGINFVENLRAVWRMLEYIYTGDYSDDCCPDMNYDIEGQLSRHAKLYVLAGEYGLDDLQDLCYKKCAEEWEFSTFINEISAEDYIKEDKDLMSFVFDIALEHADELLETDEFLELLRCESDMAIWLVETLLEKQSELGV